MNKFPVNLDGPRYKKKPSSAPSYNKIYIYIFPTDNLVSPCREVTTFFGILHGAIIHDGDGNVIYTFWDWIYEMRLCLTWTRKRSTDGRAEVWECL
jgi:hypothetical protein